jgi:FKBP-type peptidyl-prolyl cis-trans isomerase FklB
MKKTITLSLVCLTLLFGCKKEEAPKSLEETMRTGVNFLEENAKKEGVISLPSSVQYIVEKSGAGASVTLSSVVTVHYRGVLISGEEFDSSYKRGTPATFGVTEVISGWTEALLKMKVGDKWKVFIPNRLAYGNFSPSPNIPAGATLIFDIELLEVK